MLRRCCGVTASQGCVTLRWILICVHVTGRPPGTQPQRCRDVERSVDPVVLSIFLSPLLPPCPLVNKTETIFFPYIARHSATQTLPQSSRPSHQTTPKRRHANLPSRRSGNAPARNPKTSRNPTCPSASRQVSDTVPASITPTQLNCLALVAVSTSHQSSLESRNPWGKHRL